ncbi:hypothetical protein BDF20DRAFT_858219 [Mycotypha africana]|uniref:uncharacterized protein n=1 Tax=Mycotypha africana TaxID=64632 RepID=UPI002300B2A2|nr:uncharacterized protein BDF20DRAFT_858219 [Mycotypha africana]KAI8984137.1 hypothetical protein BDF20DRAFT_858219 [Mycotypha africana]
MQDIMATAYIDSQSSSSPSPSSSKSSSGLLQPPLFVITEIESDYIQFYFIHIQPYYPLFVPSLFNQQFQLNSIPRILINAICILSSFHQQTGEHEIYYQRTMMMLDEAVGRPSIAFFEKSRNLISRAIDFCDILKLNPLTMTTLRGATAATATATIEDCNRMDLELETKKRTMAMVFTYCTLLCVEQGLSVNGFITAAMDDKVLSLFLPTSTHTDEALFIDCQRCVIPFIATLSKIHQHIQRVTQRQEVQKDKRTETQVMEEAMTLIQLQVRVDRDYMNLPAQFLLNSSSSGVNNDTKKRAKNKEQPMVLDYPFPVPEKEEDQEKPTAAAIKGTTHVVSPITRFIHLLYHLNVILLHLHYLMYPLPPVSKINSITSNIEEIYNEYNHKEMCLSSASSIIRLVEYLWIKDPNQAFKYMPRGIQFLIHCITSAVTVFKVTAAAATSHATLTNEKQTIEKEHQRCSYLIQQLTVNSPLRELKNYATNMMNARAPNNTDSKMSSMNTSPSPTHYIQPFLSTKSNSKRGNTMPSTNYYNIVPTTLLHSSSADIPSHTFQHQYHQPLNNIHAMPLQVTYHQPHQPRPLLRRGMAQSCQDLRSFNNNNGNYHSHHHCRNPSVISSNSSISISMNINRPRRQNSISSNQSSRTVSPSSPYVKPTATSNPVHTSTILQPQAPSDPFIPIAVPYLHQNKIKRVKKSISIHGMSDIYHQQQQQAQVNHRHSMHEQSIQQPAPPPQVQGIFPLQHQQFNSANASLYTQQPTAATTTITALTPAIPAAAAITTTAIEDNFLHRPYQPSLDDDLNTFPLIGQHTNNYNNKKFMELLHNGSAPGTMVDTTMMDNNFNFFDIAPSTNMMMMDYDVTTASAALSNHGGDILMQQQQQQQYQ